MPTLPDVVSPTVEAIYRGYEERAANEERERTYLGASVIGDACERKLWYAFRWASPPERFEGRILRLFQTGHREEDRMVEDLRRAGLTVHAVDPASGEQWAISLVGGHFCGHLDGIVEGVVEAPKTVHVLECKTHNLKSFDQLVAHGVKVAKPEHFAQMQTYMRAMGIERALYIAHCKNDDRLHIERVKADGHEAMQIVARAERIIRAETPPTKLHDDPAAKAAYRCRSCTHLGVCHERTWPRRNCRTCLHSTPEMDGNGRWSCARWDRDIGTEEQRVGCPHHLFLPALVPGEQIDATEAGGLPDTVTYRLADGSRWTDGASGRSS